MPLSKLSIKKIKKLLLRIWGVIPKGDAPAKISNREKINNFFKLVWVIIKSSLNLTNYKISHINTTKISPELTAKLKNFEASFTYPFSEQERFRIEHGANGDYFSFFKQLGDVHYYVATCKKDETVKKTVNGEVVTITREAGEIAAVGCGVLRTLKTRSGKPIKAWYFCDIKVRENYQGNHLPLMLIKSAIWRYFQSSKGFAA